MRDMIQRMRKLQASWRVFSPTNRIEPLSSCVHAENAVDKWVAACPVIVCLCGSTRFWEDFQKHALEETLAGKIVLSIGAASGTDDEHFSNMPREEYDRVKAELDALHLRKIELADEVLIINTGGYVGESTARELEHARALGKAIRFTES